MEAEAFYFGMAELIGGMFATLLVAICIYFLFKFTDKKSF